MPVSDEVILLLHPAFGIFGILAALWAFVETLNASPANGGRIRTASLVSALSMWLSLLAGGYWYVNFYALDKALIKSGPWPFAHSFFMEAKEHVFFALILLATYLPIAAAGDLPAAPAARRLVLTVAALIVALGLAMEGAGAVVALGAKLALTGG